jgi:hypothetical protein
VSQAAQAHRQTDQKDFLMRMVKFISIRRSHLLTASLLSLRLVLPPLLVAAAPSPAQARLNAALTRRALTQQTVSQTQATELSRRREAARKQFADNFRELQVTGYALLREHEAGRLKPARLSKGVKSIQKRAKNLRSLTQLGEPPPDREKEAPPEPLAAPQAFDQAIRRLASLIYTFSHNPVHQNNKVFNTDEAARALRDLLAIIDLAKELENHAEKYAAPPPAPSPTPSAPATSGKKPGAEERPAPPD